MTTSLTVGSNVTIPLFKFEPFSYTWTYPGASRYTVAASTSVAPFIGADVSTSVVFSSSNGIGITSLNEAIVIRAIQDPSAIVLATSSNTVTIGAPRFVDDVSASLTGRRFTFYKGEPIPDTVFSSFFSLTSIPLTTPTLPAGITFISNAPARYTLQGTPLVQTPSANYTVVGSNPPNYIQCPISIAVNAERMVLDLSGTGIVSQMQVDVSIAEQSLYARCPPYPRSSNTSNIRYTWTQLPGGLEVVDSSGIVRTSPFVPSDVSATLRIRGAPTVAGARQFADLGISQTTVAVTATRFNQAPILSNSQSFTFSFGETVLFDTINLSNFFFDVQLDPSAQFVRAQTYFTSPPTPITSIISPDLGFDLSLVFVPAQGRAYFTGIPDSIGSASYTFRAISCNAVVDTSAVVTVVSDSISVIGPVDTCYNFVRSRPLSNALTGYYPAPISWTATAASQRPVTFSATGLATTGIDVSITGSTVTLSGAPTAVTSLRNLRIDISANGSPATTFRDVSFAVINDQFTFTQDPITTPTFIQNRMITPVRFSATALSSNTVRSYSSANLPTGIALTNFGVLQGTPLVDGSGTATIVATTGLASGSNAFPYSIVTDTVLLIATPKTSVYGLTSSVSVQISGVTFTGVNPTGYALVGLSPTYGLTIDPASGLLSGTLSPTLPLGTTSFSVTAQSGLSTGSLSATLTKTATTVTLSFASLPSGGPTIVSPTQTAYTLYQYVTISPIQFVATGTGDIRYYLRTADLPAGMSFNPITATLSGKTVERGTYFLTVYAEDSVGVTVIPLTLTTIFPVIVRNGVTVASAYTSLLRQYTVVNAARNAENNEVYPSETRTIGTFARSYPPDETTQTVDPKCYSTSNCP